MQYQYHLTGPQVNQGLPSLRAVMNLINSMGAGQYRVDRPNRHQEYVRREEHERNRK